MIYLDTSVALAFLLAEDRSPPEEIWGEILLSSRLLEYEWWTRIHARGLMSSHGATVEDLLSRIYFLELIPPVLNRARHPFPAPVRTLDALHLAAVEFVRTHGFDIQLATYDLRMRNVAREIGVTLVDLE